MSEYEINRVVVSGRLVSDPELSERPDGTAVCVLRLASGKRSRVVGVPHDDRDGCDDIGECGRREFGVLVLGAKARRITPYLYAGRRVIVQGQLEAVCWEAGEGWEREAMCVLAERVFFADDGPWIVGARERARRARIADTAACVSAAVGYSEQLWC
jgi:single-stranded DNA-binding protein